MKTKFLVLVVALLGLSLTEVNAQSYENMPAEVQRKMNENKASGLPLKTGVWVDYELTIEGVSDVNSAKEFEAFLKKECGLKSFRFDPLTKHVHYTVSAEYDLDGIAAKVKSTKYGIGLFFKEQYHI